MKKSQATKSNQSDPQQVFRQFAWLLAGTLASRKPQRAPRKPAGR